MDFLQTNIELVGFFAAALAVLVIIFSRGKNDADTLFPPSPTSTPAIVSMEIKAVPEIVDPVDPIEEVAELLGQKTWFIKILLGIEIPGHCLAVNEDEAETVYGDTDEGSDEEYHTILRWIEVVETRESIETLYAIIENCRFLENKLSERTDALFLQWVNEASSQGDLEDLFFEANIGSEAEALAVKKLYEIFKKK